MEKLFSIVEGKYGPHKSGGEKADKFINYAVNLRNVDFVDFEFDDEEAALTIASRGTVITLEGQAALDFWGLIKANGEQVANLADFAEALSEKVAALEKAKLGG